MTRARARRLAVVPLVAAGCLLEFDPALSLGVQGPRITASWAHTCAIADDDTLWCWGQNTAGQLGRADVGGLVHVGDTRWKSIDGDGEYVGSTCGVRSDDVALCWGTNGDNELGNPDAGGGTAMPTPIALDESVQRVATGVTVGLALDTSGRVWTWGWNGDNRLGFAGNQVDQQPTPRLLEDEQEFVAITYGVRHGCGIAGSQRTLWCWGEPAAGRLGRSSDDPRPAPIDTRPDHWRTVAAGLDHTCAIAVDGSLWCWGSNVDGQLGVSGAAGGPTPIRVGAASDWISVSCGNAHTCGLRSPGRAYCWGDGERGQLGTGIARDRPTPTRVGKRSDWTEIVIGGNHSCGHTEDGKLWCWGDNSTGQTKPTDGYADVVAPEAIELE